MKMNFLIGLSCFAAGTVIGVVPMSLLQINRINGSED